MRIFDQLERHGRRWTLDADGHHVQFGDLLDEVIDIVREDYDLFTAEELLEELDPVLTKADPERPDDAVVDKVNVRVHAVRAALTRVGISQ